MSTVSLYDTVGGHTLTTYPTVRGNLNSLTLLGSGKTPFTHDTVQLVMQQ
jgi:hypothetical protein